MYICSRFQEKHISKVQRKAFIRCPDDSSGRMEKCEDKILILQSQDTEINGEDLRVPHLRMTEFVKQKFIELSNEFRFSKNMYLAMYLIKFSSQYYRFETGWQ